MTCKPEITRRYRSRAEAELYLAARGFLCLPGGWQNGRWAAMLEGSAVGAAVTVTIWLRGAAAA